MGLGLGHCFLALTLTLTLTLALTLTLTQESLLYRVNGVLMFLSFFVVRIVFNWWLYLSRFWWQVRVNPG